MDAFDSHNSGGSRDEASSESDLALWKLLAESPRVEASPYFARKVLRAIETPSPQPIWWQSWSFLFRTLAPSAVCAGIALVAIFGSGSGTPLVASADLEFETIQNLDLLVSNYESSIWLDPTSPSPSR